MKRFEIYNKELVKNNKDKYNFIINEVWYTNTKSRAKFYEIKKNDETILSTSLHQTWYKYIRLIKNGREMN